MKILTIIFVATLVGCSASGPKALLEKPVEFFKKTQTASSNTVSLAVTPLSGGGSASNIDEYLGNGTWTLVMFWSSVMGISMFEEVIALNEEADESKLIVIGVSIDKLSEIHKSRQKQYLSKADYPNYRANQAEIFSLYESLVEKKFRGTPTFLLFDRQGVIAATDVGVLKRDRIMKFINDKDQ